MHRQQLTVDDLYKLAAQLGVGICEACDRAKIARSTPSRWKAGTVPRPQQLAKLRAAIVDLSRYPEARSMEMNEIRRELVIAAEDRAKIRSDIERLDKKLDDRLGRIEAALVRPLTSIGCLVVMIA